MGEKELVTAQVIYFALDEDFVVSCECGKRAELKKLTFDYEANTQVCEYVCPECGKV